MKWSIEYRNLNLGRNFYNIPLDGKDSMYDLDFCKSCKYCIFIDKLINHVICNSENIYYNIWYYDISICKDKILRCSYGSTNEKIVTIGWLDIAPYYKMEKQ